MSRRPTTAHLELLDYINAFVAENGYAPSFDDILENTRLKSKGHISVLLNKLESEGLAQKNVSEISCHGFGAYCVDPEVRTIIDIGGQDAKVIKIDGGGRLGFLSLDGLDKSGSGRA